eukprot:sb/3463238/
MGASHSRAPAVTVEGRVSHNNVKTSSIFVSQADNLWRLAGLENVTRPADIEDVMVGSLIRSATPDVPASPEDIDGTFRSNAIHCRDVWMMGHLIVKLTEKIAAKQDGELIKFRQMVKHLLCSADPRKRPSMEEFLSNPYFTVNPQSALINSIAFLEAITVKSEDEKRDFFRTASSGLFHVSSDHFQRYLMRLIFSDLCFAEEDAREYLLPRLLTVKTKRESRGFYKAESYARVIAPALKELYKRRAKHTRLVLLRLSRCYVPYLPTHFVKDALLPEILMGLNDTDDAIVMATFHGLAVLTSCLGATTVVGSSLQKSHFHDATPRGTAAPPPLAPGEDETSFKHAMNGQVVSESDLDSGKEYPLHHADDVIRLEREKRAEEFKKRREAKKNREAAPESGPKLIEVASHPPVSTPKVLIGETTDSPNPNVLKKERFTRSQLLAHEREGFTMEYKGGGSDGAGWGDSDQLEFSEEGEGEEGGGVSLLEIVKRASESRDDDEDIAGPDDTPTPVNTESKPPSEEEEGEGDVFGWDNGGWSDFDTQLEESDQGIEMRDLKLELQGNHPTVSDIMKIPEVQEPEEEDFFSDMKPTYTAPKLL